MPAPDRPDSIQDSGVYVYWSHQTNQERVDGALIGKVAIEHEMLPWEPILITVNCKGLTAYTSESDSEGNFTIVPNRIRGYLSLQGDRLRQMRAYFEGCSLEAFLTGFRSTAITLTQEILRDNPNVGTITLSRNSKSRITAMSVTAQSAPPEATKSWNKAGEHMTEGRPEKARRELQKAVKDYPAFANAWYELGRLQERSSPQDAKTCFEKAAAVDPDFVPPYERLAALAAAQEDWQSVVNNTNHSVQLDPSGSMAIWYYDALANFQMGRVDAAEASAQKLMVADPLHNVRNGEQLLAAILARKADYAGALTHLRQCLTYIPEGPNADLLKEQIAFLEKRVSTRSRQRTLN